jgi:predicted ATPase
MILINLFAGPGGGKTTLAAYLFYRFKQAGFRAELVGEAAREIIYDRNNPAEGGTPAQLLDNQLLISGLQYERIKRLERHGIEIAIADSPLRMGLVYAKELPEYVGLKTAIEQLELGFPHTFNVFVQRTEGKYDKESRAQTEEEAVQLDRDIINLNVGLDWSCGWGAEAELFSFLEEEAKRGWN